MVARVVVTSGFSLWSTGGVREFTVEAKNLCGVIKEMDRPYPVGPSPRGRNHRRDRRRDPRDRLFPADSPGPRGPLSVPREIRHAIVLPRRDS